MRRTSLKVRFFSNGTWFGPQQISIKTKCVWYYPKYHLKPQIPILILDWKLPVHHLGNGGWCHFFGNKTPGQRLGANSKKSIFCSILLQICYFLHFFSFLAQKNGENDYFDQHLRCAAPKPWSKYTTPVW